MGNLKKVGLRPKAKRYTSETLPDRELVAFSIIALLRAIPVWYLTSLDESQESSWIPATVEVWRAPLDPAIKLGLARMFRGIVDTIARLGPETRFFDIACSWLQHTAYGLVSCIPFHITETCRVVLLLWQPCVRISLSHGQIYRRSACGLTWLMSSCIALHKNLR